MGDPKNRLGLVRLEMGGEPKPRVLYERLSKLGWAWFWQDRLADSQPNILHGRSSKFNWALCSSNRSVSLNSTFCMGDLKHLVGFGSLRNGLRLKTKCFV